MVERWKVFRRRVSVPGVVATGSRFNVEWPIHLATARGTDTISGSFTFPPAGFKLFKPLIANHIDRIHMIYKIHHSN